MELVKPEPLVIGGKAHYTLTSYGPVSVEVEVPNVSEEDVDLALAATVAQAGGTPEDLYNDIWVHKTFPEVLDGNELRAVIREQMLAMQAQITEEQKAAKCADALAQRLVQRVPQGEVAPVRSSITQAFAMSLKQDGLTESEFLQQTGMRHADVELMFDQQAQATAEREAAIGAWAEYHKLQVTEDELAELLGIPEDQRAEMLNQARRVGQIEHLRDAAVQNKAMGMILSECNCTYVHEPSNQQQDKGSGHPHLKLM